MSDATYGPTGEHELGRLMDGFAAYHPPNDQAWQAAYTAGLIVLDTNALLDLYKLSTTARQDYLAVLNAVRNRIYVPYQVALEFHRSRIKAVDSHRADLKKIRDDVSKAAAELENAVNRLAKRTAPNPTVEQVRVAAHEARSLAEAVLSDYELNPRDMASGRDPVLIAMENVLDGRVGARPHAEILRTDEAEGRRRIGEALPPGFADGRKAAEPHGDYLWWADVLRISKDLPGPVLIVTNDVTKGDWTFDPAGVRVGAHPFLVEELIEKTGHQLLLSTVTDFLKYSEKYLGPKLGVSDATLTETSELDSSEHEKLRQAIRLRDSIQVSVDRLATIIEAPLRQLLNVISLYTERDPNDTFSYLESLQIFVAYLLDQEGVSRRSILQVVDNVRDNSDFVILYEPNAGADVTLVTESEMRNFLETNTTDMRVLRIVSLRRHLTIHWPMYGPVPEFPEFPMPRK